jgi:tetratricopeptide (TPR) repeat protein
MKKIITLLCFVSSIQTAFSQKLNVDSLLQKIAVEKDEDKKVDLIFSFYSPGFDANPAAMMEAGQASLKQSEKSKDILLEASAYCFIGFGYRMAGNFIKGIRISSESIGTGRERRKQFHTWRWRKNQMGHIYRDREEYDEGLKLYSSALFDAERGKNNMVKAWPLMNIGSMYFKMSKPDSALSLLAKKL